MSDITLAQVLNFVGRATVEDRRHIVEALNGARDREIRNAVRSLDIHDHVEFIDKYGRVVQGRITKINGKTVQLKADKTGAMWKVSPQLVRHVPITDEDRVAAGMEPTLVRPGIPGALKV
jgi:hypothetical protein